MAPCELHDQSPAQSQAIQLLHFSNNSCKNISPNICLKHLSKRECFKNKNENMCTINMFRNHICMDPIKIFSLNFDQLQFQIFNIGKRMYCLSFCGINHILSVHRTCYVTLGLLLEGMSGQPIPINVLLLTRICIQWNTNNAIRIKKH